MLQFQENRDDKEFSHLCNQSFNHKFSIKCDFSFFEILCRKVKRLHQSQDYSHLTSLKISLESEEIESLKSSKNLFEPSCILLLLLLILILKRL